MKRFSEVDMKTFMSMWNNYQTVEEIASVLRRSPESIIQKGRALGLKRNIHTVRMVSVYGANILRHGNTPASIKAGLANLKKQRQAAELKVKQVKQDKVLAQLTEDLLRMPRAQAMNKAFKGGATLSQIGEVVGISKQAVSKGLK